MHKIISIFILFTIVELRAYVPIEYPNNSLELLNIYNNRKDLNLTLRMTNGLVFHDALITIEKGKIIIPRIYGNVICSQEDFKNIEVFKATKSYSKNREVELFEMTEKGCQIATHTLYDLLKQMV